MVSVVERFENTGGIGDDERRCPSFYMRGI